MGTPFEEVSDQMRTACDDGGAAAVRELAEQVRANDIAPDRDAKAHFLANAADTLVACPADNPRETALYREELAREAIATSSPGQADLRLRTLAIHLQPRDVALRRTPREWLERRAEDTALWLDVWQAVIEGIDPAWDPEKPENHVTPFMPPEGSEPFKSGMSPDSLRDPGLRAAYAAHLNRNARIAERNRQQKLFRKLRTEYEAMVRSAVADAYAMVPQATAELRAMLADRFDPEFSRALFDQIREHP